MSLKPVTWEYIQGVPALIALTDMMETAIIEALPGTKLTRSAGWIWRGFGLSDRYWCGIRYDRPLLVVFENNNGNNPTYKCDLDLGEAHFFSLSSAQQFERLVKFLQESSKNAPKT